MLNERQMISCKTMLMLPASKSRVLHRVNRRKAMFAWTSFGPQQKVTHRRHCVSVDDDRLRTQPGVRIGLKIGDCLMATIGALKNSSTARILSEGHGFTDLWWFKVIQKRKTVQILDQLCAHTWERRGTCSSAPSYQRHCSRVIVCSSCARTGGILNVADV